MSKALRYLLKTFAKPPKLEKGHLTDQITFEHRQFPVFLAIIEQFKRRLT